MNRRIEKCRQDKAERRETLNRRFMLVCSALIMIFTILTMSWISNLRYYAYASSTKESEELEEMSEAELNDEQGAPIETESESRPKKSKVESSESDAELETETETDTEIETETETETETEAELETETETEVAEKQISDYPYDYDKAVALAQLMWGEARGCSKREQSMVAWTVLNRVDAGYGGSTDFWSILTAPSQFYYWSGEPYEEYEVEIAIDVLQRWAAEKDGVEDSGRTLPKGYLYYYGDGAHNYFSPNGSGGSYWFDLGDPYS